MNEWGCGGEEEAKETVEKARESLNLLKFARFGFAFFSSFNETIRGVPRFTGHTTTVHL
jgi:hypothetical protein